MNKVLTRLAVLVFALLPVAVSAAPITLKLAFITSEQSATYRDLVKPFVDAVNSAGKGLVEIVVYPEGVLGRGPNQQQLVRDGTVDIALISPVDLAEEFPDSSVIQLPGLFRDHREGTLVYNRLIARDALRGYDDFVVLGAYVTEPETIHSRLPIGTIDDLKGQTIRVENAMEGAALKALGATPVIMPIYQIAEAIGIGTIGATALSIVPLADFGITRIATHHYLLGFGGLELTLIMNRETYDALPKDVREIFVKYNREWTADRFLAASLTSSALALERLTSDSERTVVLPSTSDLERAQEIFRSITIDWLKTDPRNQALLDTVEAELTSLRADN